MCARQVSKERVEFTLFVVSAEDRVSERRSHAVRFSAEDCPRCREVSLQSYSHFDVDAPTLSDNPAKWVCATAWGVFLPGSYVPELFDSMLCFATPRAPHPRPPSAGPNDIWTVGPAACPDLQPDGDSFWESSSIPCPRYPQHPPGALELGKPHPDAPWRFESTPLISSSAQVVEPQAPTEFGQRGLPGVGAPTAHPRVELICSAQLRYPRAARQLTKGDGREMLTERVRKSAAPPAWSGV